MKKYKLTNNTKKVDGRILYQIEALKDLRLTTGNVKKGDLGGWIELERNLSHYGDCWVFDNGMVYGNGKVCDNGRVFGIVSENGKVYDNGVVYGDAQITGNTKITGYSNISYNTILSDNQTYHNVAILGYYKIKAKFEVGDKVIVDWKVDVIEDMYFSMGNIWIYQCNCYYPESKLIKVEDEVAELFNI